MSISRKSAKNTDTWRRRQDLSELAKYLLVEFVAEHKK